MKWNWDPEKFGDVVKVNTCIGESTLEPLGKSLGTGKAGPSLWEKRNMKVFFCFPYGLHPKKYAGTKWMLMILWIYLLSKRTFQRFQSCTTGLHLSWKVLLSHLILSKLNITTFLGVPFIYRVSWYYLSPHRQCYKALLRFSEIFTAVMLIIGNGKQNYPQYTNTHALTYSNSSVPVPAEMIKCFTIILSPRKSEDLATHGHVF